MLSHDPAYSDMEHDEMLALRDRRDEHTPADYFIASYMERVNPMVRARYFRERQQEAEARDQLHGHRSGNVVPFPRTRPTTNDGARLHPDAA